MGKEQRSADLPEAKRPAVKFRMRAPYQMQEAADARNAPYKLHDELQENPSAAASLVEASILFAESDRNKIHGCRHMPALVKALETAWRQRTGKAAAAIAA